MRRAGRAPAVPALRDAVAGLRVSGCGEGAAGPLDTLGAFALCAPAGLVEDVGFEAGFMVVSGRLPFAGDDAGALERMGRAFYVRPAPAAGRHLLAPTESADLRLVSPEDLQPLRPCGLSRFRSDPVAITRRSTLRNLYGGLSCHRKG